MSHVPTNGRRRVPVENLRLSDQVAASESGPIGIVRRGNADGWTVVEYPWHRASLRRHGNSPPLTPYQHGIDRLWLVASPVRHDARHPGPIAGCVYCWAQTIGEAMPVQYRALRKTTRLEPGEHVNVKLEVVNNTGHVVDVVGVEYGPVRLVTEREGRR
jgi:hypothetical protein